MKFLAIETSGQALSLCLWEGNRPRAAVVEKKPQHHSERMMPLMDQVFKKARMSPHDIDGIVVDVGPGRFTGLRIGVSCARTLGLALQKPIVEVNSLEALAAQGSGWEAGKVFQWKFPHDLLCVLLGSIQDDVHMAVWRFHKLSERARRLGGTSGKSLHTFSHHFKLVHAPTLFTFKRFLAFAQNCFQQQSLLFVGDAAVAQKQAIRALFGPRASFAAPIEAIDARWVAALGAEKYFRREIKTYSQVKPLYLRASYAEEAAGMVSVSS